MKIDTFYLILFLGLAIRLSLAFLPGFYIDTNVWYAWALRLNESTFNNFYSPTVWTNYTPGYLYILSFLGAIRNLFNLDNNSFYYLLKLPAILSEVILTFVIYKVTLPKSKKLSKLLAIFIIFNPALIFNSSIWGQIDGVLTLALFISVYFLTIDKLIWSSALFGLAILLKPQALALTPVFLLFLINRFSIKSTLQLIVPTALILFLFSLPFFITNPIFGPLQLLSKMVDDYPLNSLFAYNFWGMLGFWINDGTFWQNLTYRGWGLLLISFYWLLITFFYIRRKLNLLNLATLALISFFFLPTRAHERYLYPGLVFLTISAWYFKSRVLIILTFILSVIHLLNLYFVYVYYNEIFQHQPYLFYWEPLYNLLDKGSKFFSFFSTVMFIILSYLILKLSHDKKVH